MSFDPGDERIAGFVQEHYGIEGSLSLLPGENRNLRVEASDGRLYVLKLSDIHTTEDYELGRLIVDAVASADLPGIRLPRLVRTAEGEISASFSLDGLDTDGRLLEYVPGVMWSEAPPATAEQRREAGGLIGLITEALAVVDAPLARRTHLWDLTQGGALRSKVTLIEDRTKSRILDEAFVLLEACALPHLPGLPHTLIHGDLNEGNLLVDAGRVCGLIDFGDCLYNPTICELGISLAYLLMEEVDPLTAGADIVAGYHEVHPMSARELEVLFPLMCGRLAVSLAISSERRLTHPERESWFMTEKVAWIALERYVQIDPMAAADRLAAGTGVAVFADRSASAEDVSERRDEGFSGALGLSFTRPLKIARGRAQYLFDERERPYLDLYNNVCHVGHCHPRVVEAGARQMARLNTNTRYLYDQLVDYGERLCSTLPDELDHCFVLNSGTEANELALRLARTFTGRRDMIVLEGAYHGHTNTMIDISPYKFLGPGGSKRAEPWVHVAPLPDGYRGPHRGQGPEVGTAYGDEVAKIINGLERPLAAFMCESLPSCGGQIIPPEEYLATAYAHVRASGGVCIADEVQVGFGRIGSHFWGFELQEVVPDIVVMGKPIGNGHPLAAVVTTAEIAEAFADSGMEFFSTFGGNPVSCAIGTAVLDVIQDEELQENAHLVGTHLRDGLRDLMARSPLIGDVRGQGLFIGIELVRDHETLEPATREAREVVDALREARVLTGTDGLLDNVIKIKPPLVVTRADADLAIRLVDDILTRIPSGTSL